MAEKRFLVNIENEKIEVGVPDFYDRNQALAIAYKEEGDPEKRGVIAGKLLDLCRPIFKAWKFFEEDREDFDQDCFFTLVTCLNAYNPKKGAFVSYLKTASSRERAKRVERLVKAEKPFSSLIHEPEDFEERLQPWQNPIQEDKTEIEMENVKKIVGNERFELIRMRIINNMTKEEMSKELGISISTIRKRLAKAYECLRTGLTFSTDTGAMLTSMEDGSILLTAAQLCVRLSKNKMQLYRESRDNYKTKYRINPLHIVKIGHEMRYRYKMTDKGLILPEFILRNKAAPKYLSEAARIARVYGATKKT